MHVSSAGKLYRLNPVSFRHEANMEPNFPVGFSLTAKDVEEITPDLVACDKEGKPYSVRYDQVNAKLLNEFLKEHLKAQEQAATIVQLKKTIDTILARLNEQQTKIKKVTDQLTPARTQALLMRH